MWRNLASLADLSARIGSKTAATLVRSTFLMINTTSGQHPMKVPG